MADVGYRPDQRIFTSGLTGGPESSWRSWSLLLLDYDDPRLLTATGADKVLQVSEELFKVSCARVRESEYGDNYIRIPPSMDVEDTATAFADGGGGAAATAATSETSLIMQQDGVEAVVEKRPKSATSPPVEEDTPTGTSSSSTTRHFSLSERKEREEEDHDHQGQDQITSPTTTTHRKTRVFLKRNRKIEKIPFSALLERLDLTQFGPATLEGDEAEGRMGGSQGDASVRLLLAQRDAEGLAGDPAALATSFNAALSNYAVLTTAGESLATEVAAEGTGARPTETSASLTQRGRGANRGPALTTLASHLHFTDPGDESALLNATSGELGVGAFTFTVALTSAGGDSLLEGLGLSRRRWMQLDNATQVAAQGVLQRHLAKHILKEQVERRNLSTMRPENLEVLVSREEKTVTFASVHNSNSSWCELSPAEPPNFFWQLLVRGASVALEVLQLLTILFLARHWLTGTKRSAAARNAINRKREADPDVAAQAEQAAARRATKAAKADKESARTAEKDQQKEKEADVEAQRKKDLLNALTAGKNEPTGANIAFAGMGRYSFGGRGSSAAFGGGSTAFGGGIGGKSTAFGGGSAAFGGAGAAEPKSKLAFGGGSAAFGAGSAAFGAPKASASGTTASPR
eukprot:g16829.t1